VSSVDDQRPEARRPRRQREPLLQVDADDLDLVRRMPPQPLGELLGDIDASLPTRAAPPPAQPPRRQPPVTRGVPLHQGPGGHAPQAQSPRTQGPADRGEPPRHATTSEPQLRREREEASRHATTSGPQLRREREEASRHTTTSGPQLRREREEAPPPPRPTLTRTRSDGPQLRPAPPPREYYPARTQLDPTASYVARAEQLLNQELPLGVGRLAGPPPRLLSGWVFKAALALISLVMLALLFGGRETPSFSRWLPALSDSQPQAAVLSAGLVGPARASGDYALRAPPSLTAEQIDRILDSYASPAAGTGQIWYNLGLERGIDPAYAVAFFIHESAAGTAQAWAGLKPDGSTTHNVGNIICAGYATCYGRFRDYPSWQVGIADWYRLIDVEYLQGRGHQTVADIIPVYAPSFENDVNGYVHVVQRLVDQWRTQGTP
jgi:hypothetical protein